MRLNWIRMAIPALLAVALSLAAISGVSAQEDGDALSEDDAAVTDEDAPVTIDILDNDADGVTLDGVGEPDHGSVDTNNDGTVTYTPDAGFSGVDSFEYTVTDGSESDEATVTITVGDVVDLTISVDVDNDSPEADDMVTYTITVINDGPDDATGVVVTDELPEVVTFGSSTPSQGTYDGDSGAWDIGDLAAGESATLEIAVTVEDPDAVDANAASVTANETDPDESNNTASAGGGAALAISCDEAATALHPSLATLVCRVFSLIPSGAQAAITSVIEAHANKVAPGWACRRHLNGDGGEPLPGCDRYFDDEGQWDPSGLCDRFAETGDVDESPLLAKRCKNVIEEHGGGNSPLAVCRRLAESDEPGDHEALAARCGELLDEGVKNQRDLCTSLDRKSVEAHPDLAQRCRNFIKDERGGRGTSGGNAIAICRTLAESDDAGEHAALAARCGELLDEGVKNPRELCASLDRESVEAHPDLAQRCRNFIKDERGGDGDDSTGTDGANLRPERGNSSNGESQSGGRPSPSPQRGNQ